MFYKTPCSEYCFYYLPSTPLNDLTKNLNALAYKLQGFSYFIELFEQVLRNMNWDSYEALNFPNFVVCKNQSSFELQSITDTILINQHKNMKSDLEKFNAKKVI